MTEKEKLMELLDNIVGFPATVLPSEAADYLLASGVRIPVRCKDCQYMEKREHGRFCIVWYKYNGHGDSGWCCYGERRADNG